MPDVAVDSAQSLGAQLVPDSLPGGEGDDVHGEAVTTTTGQEDTQQPTGLAASAEEISILIESVRLQDLQQSLIVGATVGSGFPVASGAASSPDELPLVNDTAATQLPAMLGLDGAAAADLGQSAEEMVAVNRALMAAAEAIWGPSGAAGSSGGAGTVTRDT